jgi:hypothetical protein
MSANARNVTEAASPVFGTGTPTASAASAAPAIDTNPLLETLN